MPPPDEPSPLKSLDEIVEAVGLYPREAYKFVQAGLSWDTRVTEESLTSEKLSADEVRWRVPVPANGETVVTATFDTRY